jgi:signal transduction histidine kinase
LARAAVASLVVQLGSDPTRRHLRDLLARALGDPTVELAYPDDDGSVWLDADGREQTWPDEERETARHTIRIERQGRVVAVLSHDPDIAVDPALVDSVIAAAGLALDNERLQADLRASIEALRASRARIVQAGQEERRRLERNLHDGAQQRIVAVAMTLSLAEARLPDDAGDARELIDEARAGLLRSLDELRRLSQGIHPALLTERGLGPALEELVGGSPLPVELDVDDRRYDEDAEAAAYYVVAESLANAAKHARASRVRVRIAGEGRCVRVTVADDGVGGAGIAGGSGLAGLTDRVEALGGRLHVDSAAGRGTTIEAVLPCG